MDLYLGIDASTQGVKAVVIDAGDGTLKAEAAVNFGADLPQYGAPSGFIPCDDPLVRQADPMMWLDGLELLLERLAATGIPMACSIFGISADIAMQVVGVGFIIGVVQDSVETALNSSGDALFTASAEYAHWRKIGKSLPKFLGGTTETEI